MTCGRSLTWPWVWERETASMSLCARQRVRERAQRVPTYKIKSRNGFAVPAVVGSDDRLPLRFAALATAGAHGLRRAGGCSRRAYVLVVLVTGLGAEKLAVRTDF